MGILLVFLILFGAVFGADQQTKTSASKPMVYDEVFRLYDGPVIGDKVKPRIDDRRIENRRYEDRRTNSYGMLINDGRHLQENRPRISENRRMQEKRARIVENRLSDKSARAMEDRRMENAMDRKYDEHDRDASARSRVVLTAHGLVPPVFTPRHHDGSLNLDIIPEYAHFLLHNGVRAVEIIGTDGEGPTLTVEEKKCVIDAWVKVGKETGMHIMVQVGAVPYPEVIAVTKYAQAAGADSIMTLPEVYYKPATIDRLIKFIDDVGKAAPHLPVMYYHYPNMTGVVYPAPEIQRLASQRVSNYRGIKYDTNDFSALTDVVLLTRPDQEVFLAADRLIAPAALLGVRTALSGSVNFFPRLVAEIFDAVEHSDVKRARDLQERLTLGYEAIIDSGNTVAALKAAMEIVTGIKVGPPGRPIPPITEAARHRMEHRLRELHLVENHFDYGH